jgi:hypothetical protein
MARKTRFPHLDLLERSGGLDLELNCTVGRKVLQTKKQKCFFVECSCMRIRHHDLLGAREGDCERAKERRTGRLDAQRDKTRQDKTRKDKTRQDTPLG